MRSGYDGEIRIDTRIDGGGFNNGVKKISSSLKRVASGLTSIMKVALIGALAVVLSIVAVVGFLFKAILNLGKSTLAIAGQMTNYAKKVEELKTTFASLKNAVADAFRPLILFALPWIQQIASWLNSILNLFAQVMAALTGQKGYWKSISSDASSAAGSSKEMSDNTKKAGEAAEGALASFDELNVLQMAEEPETGGGGGAGVATEWVSIGEEALSIVEKIKVAWTKVKEFFEPLLEPLGRIWEAFKRIWEQVKIAAAAILEDLSPVFEWFRDNVLLPILETLATVFENIATWAEENPDKFKTLIAVLAGLALVFLLISVPALQTLAIILLIMTAVGLLIKHWEDIKEVAIGVWESIVEAWGTFAEWISGIFTNAWTWIKDTWASVEQWFREKVTDPLKNLFGPMFSFISILANNAWVLIKLGASTLWGWFDEKVIQPLKLIFTGLWSFIKVNASIAWDKIKEVWGVVSGWIKEHVTDPVKKIWDDTMLTLKSGWNTAWEAMSNFLKSIINGVIWVINQLLSGVIKVLNFLIDGANKIGSAAPGWQTIPTLNENPIPYLAKGAVIPPNAAFLAVLGDQRSGTNIEAPEELIRKIVREETAEMGSREVTINFAGNLGALIRELKPYIDKEDTRLGRSLAI